MMFSLVDVFVFFSPFLLFAVFVVVVNIHKPYRSNKTKYKLLRLRCLILGYLFFICAEYQFFPPFLVYAAKPIQQILRGTKKETEVNGFIGIVIIFLVVRR